MTHVKTRAELYERVRSRLETSDTRDSEIDALARKGFEDINRLMLSKGYRAKSSKQSAEVTITYSKAAKNFSIVGWKGNDRYGKTATIFAAYDGFDHKIAEWDVIDGTVAEQKKTIELILHYLKANA